MGQSFNPRIVVRTSSGHRHELPLPDRPLLIGRSRDCDLILEDDYVSRRHARIESRNGKFLIVDENSRNGTVVRGQRIRAPCELRHDDEIRIGGTVLFFLISDPEEATTQRLEPLSDAQIACPIQVDTQSWDVRIEGKKLDGKLSVLEFKLLAHLYRKAGAVCSRDELGSELWGEGAYTFEMLHQLVHRLKRRIEPDPGNPRFILSIPGVGYRLHTGEPPASTP